MDDKQRESRLNNSRKKKEVVVATIQDANSYASDNSMESLKKAGELLRLATERMRPGWNDGFNTATALVTMSDGKMTKEDLEYCWQLWNEAKHRIDSRRKEIFSQNYDYVKQDLYPISDLAVYGDPYEALRQIKHTRNKAFAYPMGREDKASILAALDGWARKAMERVHEKKKDSERRQKEWQEKKVENEKKQREWELRKAEREKKQKEWEAKKVERERKQKEWEAKKAEHERKQREWEARKAERERKQREWEARKVERERKQREWEERQRERERNQREWEERKLQRQHENERRQQEWEDRKRNRGGGSRGGGGGGCYITTATCLTLGRPDDCAELTAIREFRDGWLVKQKHGKALIASYYRLAPAIVASINRQYNYKEIYGKIWENYLSYVLQLILAEENKKAQAVYRDMVKKLRKEYLNLGE